MSLSGGQLLLTQLVFRNGDRGSGSTGGGGGAAGGRLRDHLGGEVARLARRLVRQVARSLAHLT